jgi:prolyl-tRNA editing enzyme YbaK/EbsC (Cys-tRNA(Pro) deacylase)
MTALKKSAQSVQAALDVAGLDCQVREFPASTRTAKDAAQAIGCQVAEIAKTIVFRAEFTDQAVLVIASGVNRIDEARVEKHLGESMGKAGPDFVRQKTGFAIGGVPPCGHSSQVRIFLDQDLLALEKVWAAAGTPNAVFGIQPMDLIHLTGGQVIEVTPK